MYFSSSFVSKAGQCLMLCGHMLLRKTMGAGVWHSAIISLKSFLILLNVNIIPKETFALL